MVKKASIQMDQAWHIVALGFCVSLFSAGLRFTIGPFVDALVTDFGITHERLGAIVAVSMIIYGVGMAIAGRLADRWGTRNVLVLGALFTCGSLVLTALTQSLTLFAVAFAGLSSIGFATSSHPVLSSIISRYFDRRRGLAMTVLSAGAMAGIAILNPLLTYVITAWGWRATTLAEAALFLAIIVPVSLLTLPNHQSDPAAAAVSQGSRQWPQAFSTVPFWLLAIGFFSCGYSMNLMTTHAIPMLEHHGFAPMTASWGVGLIGLVAIFGSVGIGWLSDRWGRPVFLALIYFVRAAGFLGLLWAGQTWELYLVSGLGGLVWAGSAALTSAITADRYGTESVGTLFGIIYFGHQIGAAIATYLGGWEYSTLGGYSISFVSATLLLVVGGVASARLRPSRSLPLPA